MNSSYDFQNVRALCIGDLMLDRFVTGSVKRISPEAPIPVISVGETLSVPGGAANVVRNISALGGNSTLIGVVGDDRSGRELIVALTECASVTTLPITDDARPTSEKTRFVAQGQQLLRADNEIVQPIAATVERQIIERAAEALAHHDVVILSDYAKGVLTDRVIAEVTAMARAAGVPVVVDPKSDRLARYAGATVITPNIAEARLATGIDAAQEGDAERAGMRILTDSTIDAVLLTRSEKGMSLIRGDAAPVHLAASAREVFDVAGAGDTVVAMLAMGIGSGLPLDQAAHLANVAAGVVVGKRGTATVSAEELHDELDRLAHQERIGSGSKVAGLDDLVARRARWAREGLRVGFSNGCFDLLHVGHVEILEFSRQQCDRLIVGLNSDASVTRLKGPDRPINSAKDRARVLAALSCVDAVLVFVEDTPLSLITALQPDVLVKGADYDVKDIVGADIVLARGGEVKTFDLIPGRSTTATIARGHLSTVAA